MAIVGAIFTLIVALSELFAPSNIVANSLIHSPVFQVSLIIVLWFISPLLATATKINTNENIRTHTFFILGLGFLLIFVAILATWLIK